LAFIPILLTFKRKFSRECSIKYFLTQTLASLLFLVGGLFNIGVLDSLDGETLILVGLAIKLGAAPFHR
jgi:NADH:ubiquinone oxidoreductase subunit 2 (subunit N)